MHLYLRAIGLSNIRTKKDLKNLMNEIIESGATKQFMETSNDCVIVEYSKLFSESLGIKLRCEYDDTETLTLDFYYPYLINDQISTCEDLTVERHAEKESFAGMCEDYRIGVSMIFYVQNGLEYMKNYTKEEGNTKGASLSFSALSTGGVIMLPIRKNEKEREKIKQASISRNKLINAARKGDEEAIENLTLEDIDTYSIISKKIQKEDVFSLVDTFFMPYGMECDQYSIMGEIEEVSIEKNQLSMEEVYILMINCNGMSIRLCINKEDLLGEPEIGRRFKGSIWLQGKINFAND